MSNPLILKFNISLLLTHNGVEHYRVGTIGTTFWRVDKPISSKKIDNLFWRNLVYICAFNR